MGQSHANVPIRGTNREWYGFEAYPKVIPKIHDINRKSVPFLYFWSIEILPKSPFAWKRGWILKVLLEFIVSIENFIYDIKIKERSFFS